MKTWGQQSDEVKELYREKYSDLGPKDFYKDYTDSMKGLGEYSNIYQDFKREAVNAQRSLLAKYGGSDNRVDYKNFDDETRAAWKADQEAVRAKYGSGQVAYRDYLYGKLRKAGDAMGPTTPVDDEDEPTIPKGPTRPSRPTRPVRPPKDERPVTRPTRPVKPSRPMRPMRPVNPGAEGPVIRDSFNGSFNSGNGSGNVVEGDGNILGKGNTVIGDITNRVGNRGDTLLDIEDTTFGDGAEIGNDRGKNKVDFSFRPARSKEERMKDSPAMENLSDALDLLSGAAEVTNSGNRSGNSGAGSGNLVRGDDNILGDDNMKVGDIENVVGNSGDTNVNISGSTFGSGASIGNNFARNIVNGRFGSALDEDRQKEAKYGAFIPRGRMAGLRFS